MRRTILITMALVAVFGSGLARSEAEAPAVLQTEHDLAITLARGGKYTQALEILARLRSAHPEHEGLLYDETVVLTWAGDDAAAIANAAGIDMQKAPDYVLDAIARAYRNTGRGDQAVSLYRMLIARDPDNPELKFGLFFAYSDLRAFDKAEALAREVLTEIAATRPANDPAYLRARILVGLSRAYSDRLGDAQQYFESLAAEIPDDAEIRLELANIYRWRGRIDRSLEQYDKVLADEPDLVAARVGQAHSLLDAREYDDAERALAELERKHGNQLAVRNLAHRWQNHRSSELNVNARFGESSGTTFGESQYRIDASWISRPFDNRYRFLVRTYDAFAEFPEGDANRKRAGLGVDYKYARWQAAAVITVDRDGGEAGIDVAAEYRYSDQLSFGGRIETESTDTPLRGHRVGVSSKLASLHARYVRNEAASVRLVLSAQDLSDGNRARSLLLDGARRIVNRPRLKVAAIAELYGSSRDRDDVAYFSPRHDTNWLAGLRTTWPTHRSHRLDISQTLSLQAGRYDQAGFSAGSIWVADYRLAVAVNSRWYFDAGIRRQRAFYDGAPEHATWFIAGFGGHF